MAMKLHKLTLFYTQIKIMQLRIYVLSVDCSEPESHLPGLHLAPKDAIRSLLWKSPHRFAISLFSYHSR